MFRFEQGILNVKKYGSLIIYVAHSTVILKSIGFISQVGDEKQNVLNNFG